jgi:thiamine-phosphate pyrophosphorylase
MTLPLPRLHVILDTATQDRFGHVELARHALAGGARLLQFREKSMTNAEFLTCARAVHERCDQAQATLIINDRVDVATTLGCGVHLGQSDIHVKDARKQMGDQLIGGSANTVEQALALEAEGADYVGFGHVFATKSKAKQTPPVGLDKLAEVCERVSIPVIAIGGIDLDQVAVVMKHGAWGVAVIGAICRAPDPEAATTGFLTQLSAYVE